MTSEAPWVTGVRRSLSATVTRLWAEVAKFGAVGLVCYVIDIGIFNLLAAGPLSGKPLTAKVVSTVVATTAAYLGNRFWTFRHRRRTSMAREYLLFFVLNGIGLLISVGVLWFSHYALGFTSLLADNISANVVGLGLGTLFRFWSYRKWVFLEVPADTDPEAVRA